ncbi:MAG: ribonuclease P protein component [Geminicoccaceae bacterium]|nr:ribonuclease P protein component [Geminicoccaceae bacterium]MDW8124474.1 ribonuclease P protein component [Geminicoccaceae bacterium]
MVGLKRRAEFLAAAKGLRLHAPSFVLQAVARPEAPDRVGVGFTVTRKLGGAVERNRIRRRLREAVRAAADALEAGGLDIVIVARGTALTCPFAELVRSLRAAFADPRLARLRARSSGPSSRRSDGSSAASSTPTG